MQRSKNDVWVGLFVLIGLVAILFLALKSANLLQFNLASDYIVSAKFENIGGLKKAVVVGQRHHLVMGSIGQFAPTVTDVDAPQAAHGVQQPGALRIPEVDALAAHHDPSATTRQVFEIGERVQKMSAVQSLDQGGIDRVSHVVLSSR